MVLCTAVQYLFRPNRITLSIPPKSMQPLCCRAAQPSASLGSEPIPRGAEEDFDAPTPAPNGTISVSISAKYGTAITTCRTHVSTYQRCARAAKSDGIE